ncbi:MAG TPA: YggS family pyridoxal phosphate-dependent enzyme [Planctomycetaceae bacterium]|nr:YggS family pyridoxal phosphate-dependent enzyme [Planctomycetaceae bacterium]
MISNVQVTPYYESLCDPVAMTLSETISRNLTRVRERINAACERSARDPKEVRLVAVTKYAEPDWVQALYDLGHRDFGESRPQQLGPRTVQFPQDIRWHMIGHLQRNKVRPVLETGAVVHSIDSPQLLERVERIANEMGVTPRVLFEVNVSGEESKHGFDAQVFRKWIALGVSCPHVELAGLMTMAPESIDPEAVRPVFRELRNLLGDLHESVPGIPIRNELSMGMSGDFEIAIEEGATMIRLGSLLFEGL